MADPHSILKKVFGYDSFRPGQEDIVRRLLDGQDVLAVMPTGAGKSICYQVPALLLPGITIVVSPLVSLMKDQVGALVQAGVAAAFLNNSLTDNQKALMLRRAREGWYKIIYVAPERLEMPGFQRFAQEKLISMVTVDEAHCISQWGQDFRPSYLRIKAIGSLETTGPVYFRNVPVGCTATILYQMYGEQGLTPSREIAGLLLSAILSDTLVFRSPTSTPQDEATAKALAEIAGEDIQIYAEQMFEAGADLTGRTAEDVFSSDFKAFSRGDVKFGVGQSTYMTDKSRAAAEALVEPYLPEASRREGLPLIFYMFTDMKTQSTDLMFYGHNAEEIIRDAFHVEPEGDIAKLPGVVSRKKQLIPPLLAALQARQ